VLPQFDRLEPNPRRKNMKKFIRMGAALAVAFLAPAVVPAESEAGYQKPKQCSPDGWSGVFKVRAPKGTTCATAHNVLDKWMNNDGLEGLTRLRVGRDGVLWKCYGYREYGWLNPWHISCTSSQGVWVNNRYGGYMRYRSTWFVYRD
jgi:hypothetical protein